MTITQDRPRTQQPNRQGEVLKTWVFDSVGPRKYALQLRRASNGNPCLWLVEGVPQGDGAFRKFNITVWSEDFEALFRTLDEVRAFIRDHAITTPPGHRYEPKTDGRHHRESSAASSRPA